MPITKTGLLKAMNESIEHWLRMIQWVNDLEDPHGIPNSIKIYENNNESWGGNFCALCSYLSKIDHENMCKICPLNKYYLHCSHIDNAWNKLNRSEKWSTWLFYANILLSELKNCVLEIRGEI